MAREARETLVVDLLQAKWDKSNSYDQTPHISYGWFDESKDRPQITVRQAEEGPEFQGMTPFDGMKPDGSGTLTQTVTGQVEVHAWAKVRALGTATTSNPRQYLADAMAEIDRIVDANQVNPTNPTTGNQPVRLLASHQMNPVPEPDDSGLFHYRKPVQYLYSTA